MSVEKEMENTNKAAVQSGHILKSQSFIFEFGNFKIVVGVFQSVVTRLWLDKNETFNFLVFHILFIFCKCDFLHVMNDKTNAKR